MRSDDKTAARTRAKIALAAALAMLNALPAHAGRPLETEDAGVLERGDCELEAVIARSGREDPATSGAQAQFGCGIGLRSQVAAFVGRSESGGDRSDITGVRGKTAMRRLTEDQTGIAIAWGAGYRRQRGGGLDRDVTEVRAVVTHPIGPWFVHANVGGLRESDHRNRTVWGVAAERTALFGPVDAMFEFFGDGHEKTWANGGLRWSVVPDQFFVDASYGRRLGRGPSLLTLGTKFAF